MKFDDAISILMEFYDAISILMEFYDKNIYIETVLSVFRSF